MPKETLNTPAIADDVSRVMHGGVYWADPVISWEEAAEQLQCSYSALSKWLTMNPDIKKTYCSKRIYDGRKKYVILVEALPVIANMRDSDRGNQHEKKEPSSKIPEMKKKIVEKAIEITKSQGSLQRYTNHQLLDEITRRLSNDVEQLKEDSQQYQERLTELENGNPKLTTGQRQRLNEVVRRLGFELEVPIKQVWTRMHEMTGRHTIEEYVFEDYGVSINWLKKVYKKNNINW